MPPNEKHQPSSAEIALVKSWIEEGAPFDKVVSAFREPSKITGYLNSILSQTSGTAIIPEHNVPAADKKAIDALTARGVLVVTVGSATNFLSVNFINARSAVDQDLELLLPIKDQLLWLSLGRTKITDEGLRTIGQLTSLMSLNLEYTEIGDNGLQSLLPLKELTSLNLVGTKSGDVGLAHLAQLPKLKRIFLYQTNVTAQGVSEVVTRLPDLRVDTGHYQLPALVTDTLVFKGKR
jgi:Leucine Rich repeat